MIQKSVFERKINEPLKKQKSQQKASNCEMKKTKFLKDVSNQFKKPQNIINCTDYKSLYELELQMSEELREKIGVLQQKVRLLQQQNRQLRKINKQKQKDVKQQQQYEQQEQQQQQVVSLKLFGVNKKSRKELFFEQIGSFKGYLPNSMRIIQLEDLCDFEEINSVDDDESIKTRNIIEGMNGDGNNLLQQGQKKNMNMLKKQNIESSSVTMKIINDDSLIDCLCLYGVSQNGKVNKEQYQEDDQYLQGQFLQGQLRYCSKTPHQIVKHTAKLMYPQRIKQSDIKIYEDEQAVQKAVNLLTQAMKSQLKAFTLIFQPAILNLDDKTLNDDDDQNISIIDLVNREKRFYAISLSFYDFDIVNQQNTQSIHFDNSLEKHIYHRKLNLNQENLQNQDIKSVPIQLNNKKEQKQKQNKSQSLKNKIQSRDKQQKQKIKVSRKILTIFTKYSFIPFFQELLVALLKQSFQLRKQAMKRNLSQLCNFQHSKTIEFIKIFYEQLNKQYRLSSKFEYKLNEIFQIKYLSGRMNRMQSIFLELSKPQLRNYYSEIWAYPILRLFTLDSFLDTLTLILLQEKVIFICEDQHILTSTVFLFIKVLMQPFNYPYPVVSLIPNQYDYFNAPFPIVYGSINTRQNLIKQKIPKIYQNVYIILSPQGIQIISHKNYSSKIQSVKSPKLRDKLLPLFLKMENFQKLNNPPKQTKLQTRFSGLSLFLGFKTIMPQINKQQQKFSFANNNRQLAHQIIQKVFFYLNSIKQKLPEPQKVNQVRKQIQNQIKTKTFKKDLKNFDIDKQTYERVKDKLSKKTQDPFILKFLSTQIVGMQILK